MRNIEKHNLGFYTIFPISKLQWKEFYSPKTSHHRKKSQISFKYLLWLFHRNLIFSYPCKLTHDQTLFYSAKQTTRFNIPIHFRLISLPSSFPFFIHSTKINRGKHISWCETCTCAKTIDKISQLNVSLRRTIIGRKI